MKHLILAACVCLAMWAPTQGTPDQGGRAEASEALTGATLVDVRTGHEIPDSVIVIHGDRIQWAGRRAGAPIPPGAEKIDLRGRWVIPGLADMHNHTFAGRGLLWDLYLAKGVTTVRDPGSPITIVRLERMDLESGKATGPRLFFSGPLLDDVPLLSPQISFLVHTPQEGVSAVDFLVDQGADFIKIYNRVKAPVAKAIIQEAHRRGVPVTGHVPMAMSAIDLANMGIDDFEHIRITARTLLPKAEADKIDFRPVAERETLIWERFDLNSAKMKNLVSFLARKKVFIDPTLTIDQAVSVDGMETKNDHDPNNRYLPASLLSLWTAPERPDYRIPAGMEAASASEFRKREKFVGMLARAGVPILAGTDGPHVGTMLPGFGLHYELKLLVNGAGLTPLQALQAATITAATALRKESDLGTIEAGKLADFVVLDGDPLKDIGNIDRIHLVVKGGQTFDPAALLRDQLGKNQSSK